MPDRGTPPTPRKHLSASERQRIEREIRHAWNTRWPAGDSWIKGYAEDCQKLLDEIDRLKLGFSKDVYARRSRG